MAHKTVYIYLIGTWTHVYEIESLSVSATVFSSAQILITKIRRSDDVSPKNILYDVQYECNFKAVFQNNWISNELKHQKLFNHYITFLNIQMNLYSADH